ncbi:MAG: AMP-binding enzyme, partial [Jiangellaceae bacterium]
LYGSTEDGWSALATPNDLLTAPGTIGRPVAGMRVRVLDDEGRPVPMGSIGRLCVSSRLAFDGYTSGGVRPRLGGLIDTGDLGYRDDGGLFYVVGRADEMIVTGGENVFPAEIEDVLLSHPGVADARVDGVPDDEYGARLVAQVVRMESATVTAAELQAHVATRLGRHKLPREMHVVDALPKTAVGKNTRRAPESGGGG